MKDQEKNRNSRLGKAAESMDRDRRKYERRLHYSNGYVYIEMVGWMDRREKARRDKDIYAP